MVVLILVGQNYKIQVEAGKEANNIRHIRRGLGSNVNDSDSDEGVIH